MPESSSWMLYAPQGVKGFDDDDDDLQYNGSTLKCKVLLNFGVLLASVIQGCSETLMFVNKLPH